MSMISNLAKLLVPAALLLSSAAFATGTTDPTAPAAPVVEGPIPGTVQIKKITAAGTGCADASTYSTNISPDNQAFTVTFSDFIAEVGQGLPLSAGRKNCSLTLDLQIPNGWQFSIATFNYRGFMDLGPKVQAEHTTTYFFQGQPSGSFQAKEVGPKSKDFVYTEKLGLTSVYIPSVWSPCNISRALTINPSIRVSKLAGAKADAAGLINNDSVDGEITQVFGMVWRRC